MADETQDLNVDPAKTVTQTTSNESSGGGGTVATGGNTSKAGMPLYRSSLQTDDAGGERAGKRDE
jgi:hypothetical protein